jgi:hypothetical protein
MGFFLRLFEFLKYLNCSLDFSIVIEESKNIKNFIDVIFSFKETYFVLDINNNNNKDDIKEIILSHLIANLDDVNFLIENESYDNIVNQYCFNSIDIKYVLDRSLDFVDFVRIIIRDKDVSRRKKLTKMLYESKSIVVIRNLILKSLVFFDIVKFINSFDLYFFIKKFNSLNSFLIAIYKIIEVEIFIQNCCFVGGYDFINKFFYFEYIFKYIEIFKNNLCKKSKFKLKKYPKLKPEQFDSFIENVFLNRHNNLEEDDVLINSNSESSFIFVRSYKNNENDLIKYEVFNNDYLFFENINKEILLDNIKVKIDEYSSLFDENSYYECTFLENSKILQNDKNLYVLLLKIPNIFFKEEDEIWEGE